jgi:MinD superfamily P-loop ATPase
MIISIASGKGGTGKTTVATNLALSIDLDVQLLDCDVEEPNAHLFIHPALEKTETITTPVPKVDEDKCTRCGKCAEICQFKAIVVIGETVLTFHELCHSCGGCMEACPEGAISEMGRSLGVIERGHRNGLEFIHGKGAEFVLLVTEPTPCGLYDLKLAVGAVKILGIPYGLVINRSDMGDDKVKQYASTKDIPLLMEIPFDRRIAEAYSKGKALVHIMPEWKEKFLELYSRIEEIIS